MQSSLSDKPKKELSCPYSVPRVEDAFSGNAPEGIGYWLTSEHDTETAWEATLKLYNEKP
jgi:hypothetical protein